MKKYRWMLPIAVTLLFLIFTALYLIDTRRYLTNTQTMLFVWPVIGMIVIFSVFVLLQEVKKHKQKLEELQNSTVVSKEKADGATNEFLLLFGKNVPVFMIVIGVAALYIIAMETLGFIIATLCIPILWMLLFGVRDWKPLVLVPIVLTAALYIGLGRLLLIPFPQGILTGIF